MDSGEQLVGDPGPTFDPNAEPTEEPFDPAAQPDPQPDPLLEAWDPATVRAALNTQGLALHGLVGKGETDWVYTQQELDAIAPHLARILNRYDVTRAAAGSADELGVLLGIGGYTMRSIQERRVAIATRPPPNATRPPRPGPRPERQPEPEPTETASGPTVTLETPDMEEVP